jgi:hypothetical protein
MGSVQQAEGLVRPASPQFTSRLVGPALGGIQWMLQRIPRLRDVEGGVLRLRVLLVALIILGVVFVVVALVLYTVFIRRPHWPSLTHSVDVQSDLRELRKQIIRCHSALTQHARQSLIAQSNQLVELTRNLGNVRHHLAAENEVLLLQYYQHFVVSTPAERATPQTPEQVSGGKKCDIACTQIKQYLDVKTESSTEENKVSVEADELLLSASRDCDASAKLRRKAAMRLDRIDEAKLTAFGGDMTRLRRTLLYAIDTLDAWARDTPGVLVGQVCALYLALVEEHEERRVLAENRRATGNNLSLGVKYTLLSLYHHLIETPVVCGVIKAQWRRLTNIDGSTYPDYVKGSFNRATKTARDLVVPAWRELVQLSDPNKDEATIAQETREKQRLRQQYIRDTVNDFGFDLSDRSDASAIQEVIDRLEGIDDLAMIRGLAPRFLLGQVDRVTLSRKLSSKEKQEFIAEWQRRHPNEPVVSPWFQQGLDTVDALEMYRVFELGPFAPRRAQPAPPAPPVPPAPPAPPAPSAQRRRGSRGVRAPPPFKRASRKIKSGLKKLVQKSGLKKAVQKTGRQAKQRVEKTKQTFKTATDKLSSGFSEFLGWLKTAGKVLTAIFRKPGQVAMLVLRAILAGLLYVLLTLEGVLGIGWWFRQIVLPLGLIFLSCIAILLIVVVLILPLVLVDIVVRGLTGGWATVLNLLRCETVPGAWYQMQDGVGHKRLGACWAPCPSGFRSTLLGCVRRDTDSPGFCPEAEIVRRYKMLPPGTVPPSLKVPPPPGLLLLPSDKRLQQYRESLTRRARFLTKCDAKMQQTPRLRSAIKGLCMSLEAAGMDPAMCRQVFGPPQAWASLVTVSSSSPNDQSELARHLLLVSVLLLCVCGAVWLWYRNGMLLSSAA